MPLSIYNKSTSHSLEKKIIINTSVFIRRHIVLVFLPHFIHLLLLSFLSYSLFKISLILPLDMSMSKIYLHALF